MKKIIILLGLFIVISLGCDPLPSDYRKVVIDNRTTQEFIIIFDDSYGGKLMPGGVDEISSIRGMERQYELRWIDGWGINIISFPITFNLKKVYITEENGKFKLEFVGKQ